MTVLKYGETAAREVSKRIASPFATLAVMAAIDGTNGAADGQIAMDISTGKLWRFSFASVLTADNQLVAGAGTGRWLLMPGMWDLALPIGFATADAAVLLTVPTAAAIYVPRCYWEITTSFTGGTNSSIGLSSSQTVGVDHSTKGDLLAAALAAALTSTIGISEGTIGADIAAGVILRAASTVRYDRIVDAFTAGAGFAHVIAHVLKNPGA